MSPHVLSATTIVGGNVRNALGDSLGKIDDLVIDLLDGRIAYAVLSFGGFLGLGDKLFAIPWRALTLRPDHKSFVLGVSKELLERAPGFDKNNWPDMSDATWRANVDRYFGVASSFEAGA